MFIQNYFIRNIQIYFHATFRGKSNSQSAPTCFWSIDLLRSGFAYALQKLPKILSTWFVHGPQHQQLGYIKCHKEQVHNTAKNGLESLL